MEPYLDTRCYRCSSAPTCPRRTLLHWEASDLCRCGSVSARLVRSARYRETSLSTLTSPRSLVVRENRGKRWRDAERIPFSEDGWLHKGLFEAYARAFHDGIISRHCNDDQWRAGRILWFVAWNVVVWLTHQLSAARHQQETLLCSLNDWRASTFGCQKWLDEFLKHLPGKKGQDHSGRVTSSVTSVQSDRFPFVVRNGFSLVGFATRVRWLALVEFYHH